MGLKCPKMGPSSWPCCPESIDRHFAASVRKGGQVTSSVHRVWNPHLVEKSGKKFEATFRVALLSRCDPGGSGGGFAGTGRTPWLSNSGSRFYFYSENVRDILQNKEQKCG